MATSVSSLNNVQGAKGVGLHNNNSNNSTPRNDSGQPAVGSAGSLHHNIFLQNCNMESNSSIESDTNTGGSQSFHTNQQPLLSPSSTKKDKQKRRKQSRPHRIPNSEDESQNQVLNLSKETKSTVVPQTSPKTGSNSFSSLFPNFGILGQPQHCTSTTSSNSSSSPINTIGGANAGMVSNTVSCNSTQGSIPPPRIFNPEAFCDLCNKEFCNKYFLKTHKANKHGVYFDPPSQGSTSSNPTATNGNYFSPSLAGGTSIGTDNSESWCSYCQKDFQTKYFLRRHSIRVHGLSLPRGSSGDDDDEDIEEDQETRQNEDTETIPENNEIERNTTKQTESKIPPPNPSSHTFSCSFCSKDFSSESHLRLHITKKHGLNLQVPPFLLPFATPGATQASSIFYSADSFLGGIITKGADHPYECHRCSRSFSTIYLLRMHNSYFHPVSSPPPSNNNNDKGAAEENLEEYDQKENIKEECFTPEGGTSDSDDLRRLQTMLIGLNPVSSGQTSGITEDFVNSLAWNPANFLSDLTPPPPGVSNTSTVCPICAQEFYSPTILAQHIDQIHGNSEGKDAHVTSQSSEVMNSTIGKLPLNPQGFLLPPPSGGGGKANMNSIPQGVDRRPSPSLSRSYCTICHKELCNKYFMRTHMLKMHGISIESSTGLGGVTCDICNKELCSKYFLKVHKQNTHGIVDEGPSPPAVGASQQFSEDNNNSGMTSAINTPPPRNLSGCSAENSTAISASNVSNNTSLESPLDLHAIDSIKLETTAVCHICSKTFKSSKLMKSHLQSDHGIEGRDKWKETKRNSKDFVKEIGSPNHKKPRLGGKVGFQNSGSRRNGGAKEDPGQTTPRLLLDPLGLLFGKTDGCNVDIEGNRKTYKCSFCSFTTPLLVYLYAHERTHTGLAGASRSGSQIIVSPLEEAYLQCPMCFQTYSNLEPFQHHLLSHGMSGVLAPFLSQSQPLPQVDEEYEQVVNGKRESHQHKDRTNGHNRENRRRKIVYGCSACHYQFDELGLAEEHVSTHNHSQYMQVRGKEKLMKSKRKGKLQCRKCRYTTTSFYKLQLHSKGFHLFRQGTEGSRKMIQLVRREKGVVLQRFLMTEDYEAAIEKGIQSSNLESNEGNKKGSTGQFVPSFIYLPVHKKVREKVQVSFLLHPQP